MFCPLCGKELKETSKYQLKNDHSIWYKCESCKSFGDDYPLVMHYPNDIESEPSDSFSLTWIK